jgi:hypothetical protein
MKVTDFINTFEQLGGINRNAIQSNSTMNESFLDFANELFTILKNAGCTVILTTGTSKRPELQQGSGMFVTFEGDNSTTCYTNLYAQIKSLQSKYPNANYEIGSQSVLIYSTPKETNVQSQKKVNWNDYPCVTKNYKSKTEGGQTVYDSGEVIYYGNGVLKNKSTNKTSYYHCGTDGKPKEGLPSGLGSSSAPPQEDEAKLSFLDTFMGKYLPKFDSEQIVSTISNLATQNLQKGQSQNESRKKEKLMEEIHRIKKLLK